MKNLIRSTQLLIFLFALLATANIQAQGKMINFDGFDDHILLPGTWGGASLTEVTIEAWVRVSGTTGNLQAIVSSTDVNQFVHFQLDNSLNISCTAYVNLGSVSLPSTPTTLSIDRWYHVAVVLKSGASDFYLDGQKIGTTQTGVFDNINASSAVAIGRGFQGSRFFKGDIDDVRIWNVGRTAEEIRENMHLTLSGSTSNLEAYYSFDNVITCNGTAGEIADESANSFDATCSGMDNSDVLQSDAAIGSGSVNQNLNINGGAFSLGDLDFQFDDDFDNTQDVYVHKITNAPNTFTGFIGDTLITNAYYIVEVYENGGAQGSFDLNLTINGLSPDMADQSTPSNLKLMNRSANATSIWNSINEGSSATASSVTFDGVGIFGQFNVSSFPLISSSGSNGKMIDFDGVDDHILLPGIWGGAGSPELTVEAWIYMDENTGDIQTIIASPVANFMHFQVFPGGSVVIAVYANSGLFTMPQPTLAVGEWHHIALSVQSGNTRLYLDGVQVGATVTQTFTLLFPGSDVTIGRGFGGSRFFSGKMKEVRIWDKALTEDELRSNLHLKLNGDETDLKAYYSFDNVTTCDGTSGEIIDESINSNDATCVNMNSTNITEADAPVGSGSTAKTLNVTGDSTTLGNIKFVFDEAFDNPQDLYVTEFTNPPNSYLGISESNALNDRYYVIRNFGVGQLAAGDFDVNLSFTLPDGYISDVDQGTPSGLKLYDRESNSVLGWTNTKSGISATANVVTFDSLSSFSQMTIASNTSTLQSPPGKVKVFGILEINDVYRFPVADGTANQVLTTDGAGEAFWNTLASSGDTSTSNELQTLSISSNDLTLSNGGGTVSLPSTTQSLSFQNDSLSISDGNTISIVADLLSDADNNTKIEVEQSANEDIVRMSIAGTERLTLDANGLEVDGSIKLKTLFNLQQSSTPPATPVNGDIYLDDGTNTADTLIGFRYFNGASWIDI